ncbi:hypothetical protein M0R45_001804 [Rubus argutus]|uniref:Pentatricopeptide repeat-containing protein n=1 Tax=Rubus argutus TaxID=59490 RepID=A0AAW1VFH9_RUBAR
MPNFVIRRTILGNAAFINVCRARLFLRLITIPIPNHASLQLSFASTSKPKSSLAKDADLFSLNKRISNLIRTGRIAQNREAFDQMKQRNIVPWNSMITVYVQRRDMAKARNLFDEMPDRDVVSWNLMISGYISCRRSRYIEEESLIDTLCENEDFTGALQFFAQMQLQERSLIDTLSSVFSVCTGLVDLHLGMQVHQLVTTTFIADMP